MTTTASVLNLKSAVPVTVSEQRNNLDFLERLNRIHQRRLPGEEELEARIQNYELAARMQLAAADVLDISNETAATAKLYGLEVEPSRVEVITDVVQGLYIGLQVFSEPGDGVVIQTPIYPPFLEAAAEMKRRPVFRETSFQRPGGW